MPAPFDLRFVLPVQPPTIGCDIAGLVPYEAPAILPVDDDLYLPASFVERFKLIERQKCAELKELAARFNSSDVIHFVVGFLPSDYEAAANCAVMRRHRAREAVWSLIKSMYKQYGTSDIDSLVAMHLESEFPHVHVAISRLARSGALVERINTLPAQLLPLN